MAKTETYLKVFETEDRADQWMRVKNKACAAVGNRRDIYCVVEHPEGFAVCDLKTAIETELPYRWAA